MSVVTPQVVPACSCGPFISSLVPPPAARQAQSGLDPPHSQASCLRSQPESLRHDISAAIPIQRAFGVIGRDDAVWLRKGIENRLMNVGIS